MYHLSLDPFTIYYHIQIYNCTDCDPYAFRAQDASDLISFPRNYSWFRAIFSRKFLWSAAFYLYCSFSIPLTSVHYHMIRWKDNKWWKKISHLYSTIEETVVLPRSIAETLGVEGNIGISVQGVVPVGRYGVVLMLGSSPWRKCLGVFHGLKNHFTIDDLFHIIYC